MQHAEDHETTTFVKVLRCRDDLYPNTLSTRLLARRASESTVATSIWGPTEAPEIRCTSRRNASGRQHGLPEAEQDPPFVVLGAHHALALTDHFSQLFERFRFAGALDCQR